MFAIEESSCEHVSVGDEAQDGGAELIDRVVLEFLGAVSASAPAAASRDRRSPAGRTEPMSTLAPRRIRTRAHAVEKWMRRLNAAGGAGKSAPADTATTPRSKMHTNHACLPDVLTLGRPFRRLSAGRGSSLP